ncbi:MAG: DUF262 domain-containing protein [Verrucomicrobiota bacterium]|jgi:hypothetical protein
MSTTPAKTFRIEPFQAHTLTWWKARRSKIDVDPPYQRRGRLWSDTDKAYLIDSILNGYDVPKLYMADFTWGDSQLNRKKLPYAIIDGKQRLEAIFDFFDGRVVLNDDFVYVVDPTLALGGLGYPDLQKNFPEIAESFDEYNLLVMSVSAQDEGPIHELFVRLNRSKSLTGAEIRNAMTGPAPEVIRHIAKHDFFTNNVSFQVTRGQDLNASAKVLLFERDKDMRETKKRNLDDFVKATARRPDDQLELSGRRVVDVLDKMSEIFLPKDKLLSSAGVFPVYYWFVRNQAEENHHRIRKFLVDFETLRKANRILISKTPASKLIDSELTEYDSFNRSTNDQRSHKGRYDILKRRFGKVTA